MIGHIWCPACGWFGRAKRRRDRQADDTALILFFDKLAAEVRAERRQPRVTLWDGEYRWIAGPMTPRQLAALGVEVVFA